MSEKLKQREEPIGRKIARQNAVEKIWPLMGHELKSKLAAWAEEQARQ